MPVPTASKRRRWSSPFVVGFREEEQQLIGDVQRKRGGRTWRQPCEFREGRRFDTGGVRRRRLSVLSSYAVVEGIQNRGVRCRNRMNSTKFGVAGVSPPSRKLAGVRRLKMKTSASIRESSVTKQQFSKDK
ncbi:hypothetical protein LINGRAHAP2_LOCUS14324 [Linum grandiflorum]